MATKMLYVTKELEAGTWYIHVSSVDPEFVDYDEWLSNRIQVGNPTGDEVNASCQVNVLTNILRNSGNTNFVQC